MKERTLILLKPDAVQRALIGEIITRFEKTGLKIIGMKMVQADEKMVGKHYADDQEWLKSVGEKAKNSNESKGIPDKRDALAIGQTVRQLLIKYLMQSPTVALCIEGHNAIEKIRNMVGSTSPQAAVPGTIRGDYSLDSFALADAKGRAIANLIHASDSLKSSEREISIWFTKEELCPFERMDEALLYK